MLEEPLVPKPGHPLRALTHLAPDLLSTLRDELSVTTAEEFLGLVRQHPRELENLLHLEPASLARIAREAESLLEPRELAVLTEKSADDYPYRTGHDAPVEEELSFLKAR